MLPKVAAIVYIKGMIPPKAVCFNSNFYGKKPSANDVLAFLHRVVVIDTGNSSVVYRNEPWFVAKDIVIDTGNSSVVYWDEICLNCNQGVIDTGNSSVVYWNIQKFIVDGTVIDTWN